MKFPLAAALACVALAAPARAHQVWADGSTVPAWVKTQCCGPQDVHHLTAEQVHQVKGGYMVDGYPDMIPAETALPSHDGDYWIFYGESEQSGVKVFTKVFCFFVPFSI